MRIAIAALVSVFCCSCASVSRAGLPETLTSFALDGKAKLPEAADYEVPEGLLSWFERGDVLGIVRLGGHDRTSSLRPFLNRAISEGSFSPSSQPALALLMNEGVVSAYGLLAALGLTELMQIVSVEADPSRALYLTVNHNPEFFRLDPLYMVYPFLPPPHPDETFIAGALMIPVDDPAAVAARLRDAYPDIGGEVLEVGGYVVFSVMNWSADALEPRALEPSAAATLFFDRTTLMSAYVPHESYTWIQRYLVSFEAYAALQYGGPGEFTRMLGWGLLHAARWARDVDSMKPEFDAHAFALAAHGESLSLNTVHTHSERGHELARLMTSPGSAVSLPLLHVSDGAEVTVWGKAEGAMNTARLKSRVEVRDAVFDTTNGRLSTCLVSGLVREATVSATLVRCLETLDAWKGTRPIAFRALGVGERRSDVAMVVAFEGDMAEAVRVKGIWSKLTTVRDVWVKGDGSFILFFGPDGIELGQNAPVEQSRLHLKVGPEQAPRWTRIGSGFNWMELTSTFAVTQTATYGRLSMGAPLARLSPEPVTLPSSRAETIECRGELWPLVEELRQVVDSLDARDAREEGSARLDAFSEGWLERVGEVLDGCNTSAPHRAEVHERFRASAHWVLALNVLHMGDRERSKVLFESACDLGEPLACGEANAVWSLEECLEPYFPARAKTTRAIEAGTPLADADFTYFCSVSVHGEPLEFGWSKEDAGRKIGTVCSKPLHEGQLLTDDVCHGSSD